jgi:hypothetical protein
MKKGRGLFDKKHLNDKYAGQTIVSVYFLKTRFRVMEMKAFLKFS